MFYYYRDQIQIYEKYLRNNNFPVLQFTTVCLAKVAQLTIVHYYTSLTHFLTTGQMLQTLKVGFVHRDRLAFSKAYFMVDQKVQ
jgi:hypothetical protein